jgi:hypothetical protein
MGGACLDPDYQRKYYLAHKAEARLLNQLWMAANPERAKESRRRHYLANKTKYNSMSKLWRAANPEKVKENNARYTASGVGRTPEARLRKRLYKEAHSDLLLADKLRARIKMALKTSGAQKSLGTMKLIGCSIPELRERLQQQFQPGMSWDNHGQWHIDHRRPCAAFDLSDPAQQAQCFHFTNLQPLWALDNLRKGAS